MDDGKLRIIFMGTPEFSVPTLKMLIEEHEVVGVVTQPDKPKGRGHNIAISPVKKVAIENNIKVYQPQKLKGNDDFLSEIKSLNADVIIVVAYGKILSKEILESNKYGCINSHASLLPRHRGASPINFAIISGDKKSGITTMFMDEGIDTGDMLLKKEIEITDDMNAGDLHDELKVLSGDAIRETLDLIKKNKLVREKQNDNESTYAPVLTKEFAHVDFSKSCDDIVNLIRGLNPWPIAYCLYEEKKMKIYEAKKYELDEKLYENFDVGQIISIEDEGIIVKCGKGFLLITFIQFENKKAMSIKSFLNGNTIKKLKLS